MCFELAPSRMVMTNSEGVDIQIDQLSGGYKAVLSVIADIAKRLSMANPDSLNPLEEEAVILIDELDLHLHPKWQKEIVADLKRTFPNSQFIVSTHSPFIVQSLDADELFDIKTMQYAEEGSYRGWSIEAIQEHKMGVKSKTAIFNQYLEEFSSAMDNEDYEKAKMLYIMRHGKTDWNAVHKLQGKTDVPLSGEGREMVEKAGRLYRDTHFDVCFCSPLIRARETAEIILRGRNIPIIEDVRLEEMGFGVCEGTTDFTENPHNPIHLLFRAPETYVTPAEGGESLAELFERTGAFLREAAEPLLRQGKDVLIVGHGAMNASIICQIRQIPLKDFWGVKMKNAELLRLC